MRYTVLAAARLLQLVFPHAQHIVGEMPTPGILATGAAVYILNGTVAIVVAIWAGKLAVLTTGKTDDSDDTRPGQGASRQELLTVVLFLGLLVVFMRYAPEASVSRALAGRFFSQPLTVVVGLILVLLAAVPLFYVGSRILPGLARRLCDGTEAEGWSGARLLLGIGILLIALRSILWRYTYLVAGAYPSPLRLTKLIVGVALLALHGDVARLCLPAGGESGSPNRAGRRMALRPWLVFLGFLMLLEGYARAPVVIYGPYRGSIWAPISRFVPSVGGLALILAAGPLSRLLSFGPLLSRGGNPPD